ncbi:MAG: hypothetical protein GYA57_06315, partial [Myxococcales bacterium]|nr:hypothetical protein [Myxococcales bacterium]
GNRGGGSAKPAAGGPSAPRPDGPPPGRTPATGGGSDYQARKAAQRERERLARRHRQAEETVQRLEADLRLVESQMAGLSAADWQKLVDLEQWRSRIQADLERATEEWVESGEALQRLAGSEEGGSSR